MSENLSLYLMACIAMAFVPGPDMLFTIRQSSLYGRPAGFAAVLGIMCGLLVHITLVSLGLAALIVESKYAFKIIQYLGAGYLFYLGISSLFSKGHPVLDQIKAGNKSTYSFRKCVFQGFMVNLFNPKVILFFLAFLPQFVNESSTVPLGLQLFLLATVFSLIGNSVNFIVACGFGYAQKWLEAHPAVFQWQQRVMGTLFIGVAVRLFV
jgi:threonine/homoserine/homoserine lactone efflux protein